jgi:thiamine-phosphate pyrophosphorylase
VTPPDRASHLARIRGLYGMVDLSPGSAPAGRLARALLEGGARVLQVRMKGASAAAMLAVLDELRPLARSRGATLIVNDRVDVALAGGADGVHLGQDDLPLAAARRIAPHLVIGVSTHSELQAAAAEREGADYIGFGPIFATTSKARPDRVVGVAVLRDVCARVRLPVVAIGGILPEHAREVAAAGAAAAAIIGGVSRAADPVAAARTVGQAFDGRRAPI